MAVLLFLMTKIRNLSPKSFSNIKFFPGTKGNPFDRALHSPEKIEEIPSFLFLFPLLCLAFLSAFPFRSASPTLFVKPISLFLFYLTDWLLISLLPVTHRSYGPVKPVVLMLAVLRLPFAFLPQWWNLGFELLGTLLVIYGFFIEPFKIDVHKESFLTPKFTEGQNLTLIHLGDLHLERITRRETEILKDIQDLHPDLILFSGDILNLSYLQDARAQSEAVHFLSQLQAPLGVYAVSGSPAVDLPELFPELIGSTPIHWLNDQAVRIEQEGRCVTVYGLTCSHDPEKDAAALQSLLASSPLDPSSVNILLHHSPDLAPNASQNAFDLQLSGHTHGGQVRLPFYGALFTGSLYKKAFEAGRYLVNGMTLYVTRGLGLEGAAAPRVRFFCPPEMIVWDIYNELTK